jgi:hypothetical protein
MNMAPNQYPSMRGCGLGRSSMTEVATSSVGFTAASRASPRTSPIVQALRVSELVAISPGFLQGIAQLLGTRRGPPADP